MGGVLARRWFSQNGEDRRLYSILGHIDHGRYVDIGAYEPEFHSVTKVFYDDGWTGVNVEPGPRAFAMLEQQRPRDININAAVTWRDSGTLYYIPDRGRSSLLESQAEVALAHGMDPVPIDVRTMSLAEVMDRVRGDVHFLKIDVEGSEEDVIASGDWKNHRPWIVVVESKMPHTLRTVDTHEAWEPYLVSRGYVFSYDDGLNRYYTSREQMSALGEKYATA